VFKKEKLKKININVEPSKWEDFKAIAKINQSDASKELRKFIDKYLEENRQLQIRVRSK